MEVLIIDDAARKELARIKATATENPYCLRETIEAKQNGFWNHNNISYTALITLDFKVVLTIEEHPHPTGYCWHLSVSRKFPHYPNPIMVQEIIDVLELDKKLEDNIRMWFEYEVAACDGTPTTAINLLFKKET